jgi:hypothetical protein
VRYRCMMWPSARLESGLLFPPSLFLPLHFLLLHDVAWMCGGSVETDNNVFRARLEVCNIDYFSYTCINGVIWDLDADGHVLHLEEPVELGSSPARALFLR